MQQPARRRFLKRGDKVPERKGEKKSLQKKVEKTTLRPKSGKTNPAGKKRCTIRKKDGKVKLFHYQKEKLF